MSEDKKTKHYANVEEQTVLLRSIAESLAALVVYSGAGAPSNPIETQNGPAVLSVES